MITITLIFTLSACIFVWNITDLRTKLEFKTKWRACELTPSEKSMYEGKNVICERTGWILRQRWRPIKVVYDVVFFPDGAEDMTKEVLFDTLGEAENYFRECQRLGRFYSPYEPENNG